MYLSMYVPMHALYFSNVLHIYVVAIVQEGPGTVIVHPAGQDVELLCGVAIPGAVNMDNSF